MKAGVLLVLAMAVALLAPAAATPAPNCFGARAVNHARECRDVAASLSVTPDPAVADRLPPAPCEMVERRGEMGVCAFGHPMGRPVALVGDSHAGHWRGALEVVAEAEGWRGLSIMRGSCPLSKAVRNVGEPKFSACRSWKATVFAWFRAHPEVETVFVSGLTGGNGVIPSHGRSEWATAVAGYRRAWRALPPTVKQIVVIRDTPKTRVDVTACVRRAIAGGRSPARACSTARSTSLDPDPAVAAAGAWRTRRVRSVDLTRYFCGHRRCDPVIGGVLVLRDQHHMTATYSTTLGEILRRKVAPLLAR